MGRFGHWASCVLFVSLSALLYVGPARADDGADESYGRIDGDISASAGVGATFAPRGPRAALDLRVRYLWTAGVFATYEDGSLFASGAEPRRALATGLELRPLFIARWLQGLEFGNGYLDLALDSVGLELGVAFLEPEGRGFGSKTGLQAGIGLQLPLLPRATGPMIGVHGGARWSDSALAGHDLEGPADRSLYLLVTFAWQQVFGGHVVDLGDSGWR